MAGAFSVGDWHVDPSTRTLTGANGDVRLEPKLMQVLVLLAQHQGEVVTKDVLLQSVWPDIFVGDEVLSRTVSELRHALGDDSKAPRYIQTIPKGGYRLIASRSPGPAFAAAASSSGSGRESQPVRRWRNRVLWATGTAAVITTVLVGVAIGAWRLQRAPAVEASPRVAPLTTLKGWEGHPTFSPDGTQVAFTWSGGKEGDDPWDASKWDTYVKIIGSSEVRRVITSHPAGNRNPSWSPDGRHIAFLHCDEERGCRMYLTSPLGGSELKVSDLPLACPGIAWSPDSHFVAAGYWPGRDSDETAGIYLMPVQAGEPRAITRAPRGTFHRAPAFSPDGHHLAYVSCVIAEGCDVLSVDVDTSFTPIGATHRLTTETMSDIQVVTWARDGRSLFFDTEQVPFVNFIWRAAADGTRAPERVELAGFGSSLPATVPSQDRLAFQRSWYNNDVYQSTVGHPPQPLVTSTFPEFNPQFSPDGRHIVFGSPRSGDTVEIWVADADGSGEHQLLHGPNHMQGAPHWSPDGRLIAFDSLGADGHWHVWIVDAEGGQPHQVVVDAGDQRVPTWSHDGRWIYFWSEQNIWRVPVTGGRREQLTQGGAGIFATESEDGMNLLYQSSMGRGGALMTVPLNGGQARQVLPCVSATAFIAGAKGIYYIACDAGPDPPVSVLDPATGQSRRLMTLDTIDHFLYPMGLAVSPDGNSVLYIRGVSASDDLMLIENFH